MNPMQVMTQAALCQTGLAAGLGLCRRWWVGVGEAAEGRLGSQAESAATMASFTLRRARRSVRLGGEQALELCGGDDRRVLICPFEQIPVTADDEVSTRIPRESDQVIVIAVACGTLDGIRVRQLGGASRECSHVLVEDRPWQPAAQMHPPAHIADFANKIRTDHQFEGLFALPFCHDAGRRTGADERGYMNVRVDDGSHCQRVRLDLWLRSDRSRACSLRTALVSATASAIASASESASADDAFLSIAERTSCPSRVHTSVRSSPIDSAIWCHEAPAEAARRISVSRQDISAGRDAKSRRAASARAASLRSPEIVTPSSYAY